MSTEIVVPTLGESVTEATIAKWYKKKGDSVKVDELILELETEKVTLEVNATAEGVIESITKNEDDVVTPGEIVGTILAGATGGNEAAAKPAATEPATPQASPAQVGPAVASSPMTQAPAAAIDHQSTMPPSVRKLVNENSLDPNSIAGSGKDGRLNKGDVLNAMSNPGASQPATPNAQRLQPQMMDSGDKPVEIVKMSRLRRTIADRLKESQNTAAILSTFNEIDMSAVMALRKKMRDEFQDKHGVKLGFMSFFTKAVVNALKEVPSVNAEIDGDSIIYKKYYDIGVAVGTEQGLVVPVVRDCDKKGFADIEKNIVDLATKARSGKLAMKDLTGGTFSITNGGVYGSLLSTPIINPPQTGIIGLHNTQERPIAVNGKVEIRPMMYIALSYDHRIIDGKDAVTFLINVKKSIESPERLMFDM